ncbi:hypothetical protein BJ912DRAFT_628428 [Pholiota molesta]|nr:hypothetical protein BJ912DRAFT_628428 [Pholiota molesta]
MRRCTFGLLALTPRRYYLRSFTTFSIHTIWLHQGGSFWEASPTICSRKSSLAAKSYPRQKGLRTTVEKGSILAHCQSGLSSPRVLPGFLFYGKNLPAEMLKAGWALTYEQAGAEYGRLGKEGYLRLETQARDARRGMWKDGVNAETPAEYKRRHALATTLEEAEAAKPTTRKKRPPQSWPRRLLPW